MCCKRCSCTLFNQFMWTWKSLSTYTWINAWHYITFFWVDSKLDSNYLLSFSKRGGGSGCGFEWQPFTNSRHPLAGFEGCLRIKLMVWQILHAGTLVPVNHRTFRRGFFSHRELENVTVQERSGATTTALTGFFASNDKKRTFHRSNSLLKGISHWNDLEPQK